MFPEIKTEQNRLDKRIPSFPKISIPEGKFSRTGSLGLKKKTTRLLFQIKSKRRNGQKHNPSFPRGPANKISF